jgi:hypothetical protein
MVQSPGSCVAGSRLGLLKIKKLEMTPKTYYHYVLFVSRCYILLLAPFLFFKIGILGNGNSKGEGFKVDHYYVLNIPILLLAPFLFSK